MRSSFRPRRMSQMRKTSTRTVNRVNRLSRSGWDKKPHQDRPAKRKLQGLPTTVQVQDSSGADRPVNVQVGCRTPSCKQADPPTADNKSPQKSANHAYFFWIVTHFKSDGELPARTSRAGPFFYRTYPRTTKQKQPSAGWHRRTGRRSTSSDRSRMARAGPSA